MKRFAPLFIAIALSAPAFAAPETFIIDNNHTNPSFSYSHLGFSVQTARFDKTSGKVILDRAAKTGSVDVVIDTKSVDTVSPLLNEHIQGPDFLDTAAYPTATFKSTKVAFDGDRPVAIDGNLTLKGVTRPVTLKVTGYQLAPHPLTKKDAIGANATTIIKRSDFNAGKYAPNVGDDVTINIAIEAVAE
jgi:polyisoprenoid-binding protein YceI